MTRRAGYVPVPLNRVVAEKVAAWILTIEQPELTILSSAGRSSAELASERRALRNQYREIAACLVPRVRGRPRRGVSNYQLPKAGIALLDRMYILMQAPMDLRRTLRDIVQAGKRKKGARLPLADRKRNVALNGPNTYSPETRRVYEWRIRCSEAAAASDAKVVDDLRRKFDADPDLRRTVYAANFYLLPIISR